MDSIDDIDVAEVLREERIAYLTTPASLRETLTTEYDDETGIESLARRSTASRNALLILLLQDDEGFIYAYAWFEGKDLARLAGN